MHQSERMPLMQVALYAVRAAETPVLDHMAEAEEVDHFVAMLARMFMDAAHAVDSVAASWHLTLAVLMPLSQLAGPLVQHLSADDAAQPSAQASPLPLHQLVSPHIVRQVHDPFACSAPAATCAVCLSTSL